MKKNILLILLLNWTISMFGQITVTDATFPVAGDTLRFAVDDEPNIDLQSPGTDLTWDFTSLDGPAFERIILDASEGANSGNYPNANILIGEPPVAETYFQTTSSQYLALGFSGADPIGLGLDVVFKNNPPLIEQESPLNYNDQNSSSSSVLVPYAWDDLPAVITDSIAGGFPLTPDSIAIEVETNRTETVNAWGTVNLPIGNFEVLRVRRQDISETKVLAYFPFLNWTDVTDALISANLGEFLGADTTLTYRFLNDTSKEPIAIITADPMTEEPTNAQYKFIDPTTNIIKLYEKKANVYAYPNPAIDRIRFDLVNIPRGNYELNIHNILGVKIWSQPYQAFNSTDTVQLNINDFRKGTYLYSLVNESGKTLVTRRLIILRP